MDEALQDRREQWPVETSEVIFEGKVVTLRQDVVRSPVDGTTFPRDVIAHPGAVAIIALDEQDRVLVVSQYRHPVKHRLTELPAGLRDIADEPPLVAAQRELYEEGHVRADNWRVITDVFSSPGMTDEAVRVFLARDITHIPDGERYNGHAEEADMPVSWVPLADLVKAALAGQVQNSLLCIGVLAAWAASHDGGYDALRAPDVHWPAVENG